MREKLLGAVIGLARATENNEELITEKTDQILTDGLLASLPDSDYTDSALEDLYNNVMDEKWRIIPSCFTCASPCGRTDNYNMQDLSFMDDSLRDMKLKLLSGIQQLAANPKRSKEATEYLYKALILFGIFWDEEGMVPILNDLEKMLQKNR